jgi:anti-sigma regulatory factor (Ser/Thr protein kinase)
MLGKVPWVLDLRGSDVSALAGVRRWASRLLAGLDDRCLEDVLLVTSELVANAYEHGAGPLCVRLAHLPHPCLVAVEVDDANPAPPVFRQPALRGRGMWLVDRLSEAWGVHTDSPGGGKSVWTRLRCEPDDVP